ncbi:hypothetical protein BH11ACT7_BH11ACT7_06780 [soil metagenome]
MKIRSRLIRDPRDSAGIAGTLVGSGQLATRGSTMTRETTSINDIRTAIRELSLRAELARKEGRPEDAQELEQRIQGYRDELAARP